MKWPELVPERTCITPITVMLTNGVTESGAPKEIIIKDKKCNYSEKTKQVLDAERRLVTLCATVLMNGDVAPEIKAIEGYVSVDGSAKLLIARSERPRNPDGTVNYTRLELM